MSSPFKPHEIELLREFSNAYVKFAVVGGAAVILHGHCRPRKDLDLLIDGSHENIDRLEHVCLNWLRFTPSLIQDLKEKGAKMQDTTRGVDLLKEIAGVNAEDVLRDRMQVSVDEFTVPVMSLEHLIAAKRFVGDDSDIADINGLLKVHHASGA